MVEFDLFDDMMINWKSIMVLQKEKANMFFDEGVLLSYSICLDPLRFWTVIYASSESELLEIIHQLPLSEFLDFDYYPLNFHSSVDPVPEISLN